MKREEIDNQKQVAAVEMEKLKMDLELSKITMRKIESELQIQEQDKIFWLFKQHTKL